MILCERSWVRPGLSAKSCLTLSADVCGRLQRENLQSHVQDLLFISAPNIAIMRGSGLIRLSVQFKVIKGGMLRVVGGCAFSVVSLWSYLSPTLVAFVPHEALVVVQILRPVESPEVSVSASIK